LQFSGRTALGHSLGAAIDRRDEMEVGAIGGFGLGMGAMSGMSASADLGTSNVGAAACPDVSTVSVASEVLSAGLPGNLEQLAELMQGLSSSQILFLLLLLSAMQKRDDDKGPGGGAALGFLAGLALAGEVARSAEFRYHHSAPQVSAADGAAGGQLNLQA
jgi:hypothetical protein